MPRRTIWDRLTKAAPDPSQNQPRMSPPPPPQRRSRPPTWEPPAAAPPQNEAKRTTPSKVPARACAIVTCMDTRLDIGTLFPGVGPGDAHVIRNAGGVVTEDTIRSLAVSQRLGHTRTIFVVQHTDCALQSVTDRDFERQLGLETRARPRWKVGAFSDPADSVRRSLARLDASPFITHKDAIRGYVYNMSRRNLTEIHRAVAAPPVKKSVDSPWVTLW
jgi:carbonic anhydrase